MAVNARFLADFSSFYTAVQKAEVELKGLETGAGRVEKSLNKMVDDFGGRKLIQDATLMTEAVNRVGGAATLTAREQQRVNAAVTEAIAKYKALGQEAPKELQAIAEATKQVAVNTEKLPAPAAAAGTSFKTLFGAFSAANLATQAVSALTSEVTEFVSRGMRMPAISQGFERLAMSVKQDSQEMLVSLQTATKGMVSEFDLMQSANKAMLLGLPVTAESMGDLAKAATALGRAMGMDATKSLDDLITALGRSSPMILDNLGLSVKLGEAHEAFAQKLGKSVSELTEAEKKMAFYEAAMEAARKKTAELGDQSKTLGEILQTVWTSVGNQVTAASSDFNVGLGRMLSSWEKFREAVARGAGSPAEAIFAAAQQEKADALAQSLDAMVRKGKEWSAVGTKFSSDLGLTVKSLEEFSRIEKELTDPVMKAVKAAEAHAEAIKKLREQLTGQGLVKAARDLVQALGDGVRVQSLSEDAQRQINRVMGDAIDVFARMGEVAPQAMRDLWVATRQVPPVVQSASAAFKDLGIQVAVASGELFSIAGLAPKVSAGIKEIGVHVPVVERLATEAEKAADKFDEQQRQLIDLANAFDRFGDNVGGSMGSVLKDIGSFVDAITQARDAAKQMAAGGFMNLLTGGLNAASAIGQATEAGPAAARAGKGALTGLMAGAAFGPIGMGIGAAAGAITGLIRGLGKGRDAVKDFAKSFGGFDDLRHQLGALGEEGDMLWQKLTQGVGRNNPEQAKAVIGEISAALQNVPQRLNEMVSAALTSGSGLDAAMAPYLEDLIRAGQLTQENANLLLGLPAAGVPSFDEVTAAADRLGLNIDSIGQGIKQMGFTELASSVATDLDTLARAGADMEAVLTGSRDKIQKLVTDAQKFGFSLPESIKPFLQQMVDGGKLTDLFGEKLEDLEDLHFTKPLEKSVEDLIEALHELVGVIKKDVGGALDELGNKVVRPRVEFDSSGFNAPLPLPSPPQATGGTAIIEVDGRELARVTVPHLPDEVQRYGLA